MTKTTHNAEVTELSLEELGSVSGGVELVHEPRHVVANKTECGFYFDILIMAPINGNVKLRGHRDGEVEPVWPHQRRMVHAGLDGERS
jgi:hypothetical protein